VRCGEPVDVSAIDALPGPGLDPERVGDALGQALTQRHRLLEPLR
jgi:hypothetical protein